MKKSNKEEIASYLAQLTAEYSNSYMRIIKGPMDKSLWAALDVGFLGALRLCGYSDQDLDGVIKLSQIKLNEYQDR